MKLTALAGCAMAALVIATSTPAAGPEPSPEVTAMRLGRRVSIALTARPLREVIPIVEELAGLRFQPLWINDRIAAGLDPEMSVSLSVSNETVRTLVERMIEAADMTGASTWQMTASGAVQIGPRSRLNAYRRLHIYEVTDLIKAVPDHRQGPNIDLQQALQAGKGAPITGTNDGGDWLERAPRPIEKATELADLIRSVVETEQWKENGGEGGWIQVYQNSLIVSAPDYVHRAIVGRRAR